MRVKVSFLINEKNNEYIKEYIKDNPVINSFPKFIAFAVNEYIKELRNKDDKEHENKN